MQITHDEARRLIQFASDGGLKAHQKAMLDSHLMHCAECQQYGDSMQRMESILRPLLYRQWNQQPIPLSASALVSMSNSKVSDSLLVATRIAAVGVMFAIFIFSAWQFTFSRPEVSVPSQASVPLIPIPSTSTQLIGTSTHAQGCEEAKYVVTDNDTLESIADRFMVSEEEIVGANNLKDDAVVSGTRLTIPVCNFTPTVNALTSTLTPILNPNISTPGG